MPLKHSTETVLVIILALVMLACGVLTASLPPLPLGAGPWGIAFLAAVLYPLILYPFLRENRADNIFRIMHWAPAALLLFWFALAILELIFPVFFVLRRALVWGWSLIAVAALFITLVAFCLRVLREGTKRVAILVSILAVFLAVAFVGEWMRWPTQLSQSLWLKNTPVVADVTGQSSSSSSSLVASSSSVSSVAFAPPSSSSSVSSVAFAPPSSASSALSSSSSSAASSSSEGQGLIGRLFGWMFGSGASSSTGSGTMMASSSSSSVMVAVASSSMSSASTVSSVSSRSSSSLPLLSSSSSSVPPHLPTSGPGLGEILLALAVGYTGLLHVRARRRVQA